MEDMAKQKAAEEAARVQAEEQAKAQVEAVLQSPTLVSAPWLQLRECESSNNYATNTGNGYYGAYQYDLQTWDNYGGYSRPDLAPGSVQDAKAAETQSDRGWSPWPACSAKLGLSSGGS